jgi:hypothetical protein
VLVCRFPLADGSCHWHVHHRPYLSEHALTAQVLRSSDILPSRVPHPLPLKLLLQEAACLDVKATVHRIHAAEFAAKSALKLPKAQARIAHATGTGSPRRVFSRSWRECSRSSSKRPSPRQPVSFARSLYRIGAAQCKHQRGRITSPVRQLILEDADEFLTVTDDVDKALRLTESSNPTSSEIFPRMCKLTESLRMNEFVTIEAQ